MITVLGFTKQIIVNNIQNIRWKKDDDETGEQELLKG